MIKLGDALSSDRLYRPFFNGDSWALWRSIMRAAFGEPLEDSELVAFRKVTGRDPPGHRVSRLAIVAGRGAGKDSAASLLAVHTAVTFDPRGKLRPGEVASVMLLAIDRQQAAIAFSYIKGLLESVPALAAMIVNAGSDFIALSNNVVIETHANSFRSTRGRSILCAIFDEIAFWRDEASANPDTEMLAAVAPGLARVAGSMLILISSAHKRSGLLYDIYQEAFGRDDPETLVVYATTLDLNPSADRERIEKDIARDPELFNAEYNSIWRSDLSDFLDKELVAASVSPGIASRPPTIHRYFAGVDVSGGRGDSFVAAISHAEGSSIILDALYERRPPFNPSEVVAEVAALLKQYGLTECTGDNFGAEWVVEAFAKEGVTYTRADRDRSKYYLDTLPLFTAGRVHLLDNRRLIHQYTNLERRSTRLGRDSITHPPGMHDDLANAASIALVNAAAEAAPQLFRRSDLLVINAPCPMPERIAAIAASASVDASGMAFCLWGYNAHNYPDIPPLLLLDFEVNQPPNFITLRDQLATLATDMRAYNAGCFTISPLVHHCAAAGLSSAAMDDALTHRDQLALGVAAELGKGSLKLTPRAFEKAQSRPLPVNFAEPSAASDAFLLGVACILLPTDALSRAA
ncbi:MAG: hypothetical protein J0H44_13600 [Alphaproteobacteria bacterium]|nr:hypothetical protein [Alphaproteobacteria bacterium]